MEWFEMLFQQVCVHLLVRSRTAHQRREDGLLIADQAGLAELVDSYRRQDLKVVFQASAVIKTLHAGTELVLFVRVREDTFSRSAQDLINDQGKGAVRQILAASMEVDAVSPAGRSNKFDVVLCRQER